MPSGWLRSSTTYLFILSVVAVGTVLRLTSSIVVPFVIALLLSFVLSPVVRTLRKYHIPRLIAIGVVLVLFLAFGFLVVLVVYTSFQSLLQEFPSYVARFSQLFNQLVERFDLPEDLLAQLQITRTIGNAALLISGNFMSFASGFLVVFIYLLFLLLEEKYVNVRLRLALKNKARQRLGIILAHINQQIGRYIGIKILISAITAVSVFTCFYFIGVDFVFVWGVLVFLFNFIPTIGSVLISIVATLFAFIQFWPEVNPIIAAGLTITTIEFLIGNFIDPLWMGGRLNLSPVVLLFSLLGWGWLWGIAGLFLAVPLTVAIKIVFENVPGLEPFSVIMGTGTQNLKKTKGENT